MTEEERLAKEKEQKDPTVQELLDQLNKLQLETVSKEDYEKLATSNKQLIEELTNNRPTITENTKNTKADKVKAIEERVAKLGEGTSLDNVTRLLENHKAMKELGLDVSNIDEGVVSKLEIIVKEAKGDSNMFNALMESRVKIK